MIEWRDIKGYEGLYKVSNTGEVKSLERISWNGKTNHIHKERILKKGMSTYQIVVLRKDNKSKTFNVHKLVAEAFINNENNYICVNHKDEDKHNNNVENLEWCTYSHNNKYNNKAIKIGCKKSKKVGMFDLKNNLIKVFSSTLEASKYGFNQAHVNMCCLKKEKQHKGYVFKYI